MSAIVTAVIFFNAMNKALARGWIGPGCKLSLEVFMIWLWAWVKFSGLGWKAVRFSGSNKLGGAKPA